MAQKRNFSGKDAATEPNQAGENCSYEKERACSVVTFEKMKNDIQAVGAKKDA